MRKIGQFMKKRVFLMMLLLVSLLSVLGVSAKEIDQMPDLEAGRKGTLSAVLSYKDEKGAEHKMAGIALELHRVADLTVINGGSSTYTLTADFAASKVVFDGMSSSESNQAAKALKAIAVEKSLKGQRAVTDANGKVVFADLEPGMYLVMQADGANLEPFYTGMDPYLVSVPQGESQAGSYVWNYEVDTLPKMEISQKTLGRIVVTKQVTVENEGQEALFPVTNATFYVGLFKDENGEKPYENAEYRKSIYIENGSAGEVEFTNLPEGTYYVFETKEDGTAIKPGVAGELYTCLIAGDGEQKVVIDPAVNKTEGHVILNNRYTLPEGEYIEGEISIKKSVFEGNDRVNVDDTFYAGIFTKEDDAYVLNQVVELKQNDTVTVQVVLNDYTGAELTEYWVFETDKNGNRVDKASFAYEVSGEGSVKLGIDNLSDKIEIVNKIKEEREEIEESSSSTTSTSSGSVRTGDDTPIVLYAVLAGASVILLLALFLIGRRKRSH